MLHELINGLAQHKEPMRAFRIPLTPIPAGSGNGLCLNLLGIKVRVPSCRYSVAALTFPYAGRSRCRLCHSERDQGTTDVH